MSNEEILKKAIEKAGLVLNPKLEKNIMKNKNYYSIIFDKDFAKAFWGKGMRYRKVKFPYGFYKGTVWEANYHLQQMVLEKDPILYLERFL